MKLFKGSLHVKHKFTLKCAKMCTDIAVINVFFLKLNIFLAGSKPALILSNPRPSSSRSAVPHPHPPPALILPLHQSSSSRSVGSHHRTPTALLIEQNQIPDRCYNPLDEGDNIVCILSVWNFADTQ